MPECYKVPFSTAAIKITTQLTIFSMRDFILAIWCSAHQMFKDHYFVVTIFSTNKSTHKYSFNVYHDACVQCKLGCSVYARKVTYTILRKTRGTTLRDDRCPVLNNTYRGKRTWLLSLL